MNNSRRKQIEKVIDELEKIRNDEQDYFDNMPENLQYSERGEKSEFAIDALEFAIDQLQEILNY